MTLALGKVDGQMLVACQDCGAPFYTSPRTLRDQRVKGRLPRCPFCRFPSQVEASVADRRFWIDSFTIAEIVWMAECFWGDRDTWPPRAEWWQLEPIFPVAA